MKHIEPNELQPGDCILYRPQPLSRGFIGWLFGRLIAIKTWNNISHVEIYVGDGMSVAARDGVGVNRFVTRWHGMARVLRPACSVFMPDAMTWFGGVRGQKYDWKGLLCFTLAVKQGSRDRMFCSEFATRFYRAGHIQVFGQYDADHVAPAQFLMSDDFDEIFNDGKQN